MKSKFYGVFTQLINEYNDPSKWDALESINHKLAIAERKLKNAIITAYDNTEQLQETEDKTKRMLETAEDMEDGSKKMKDTMTMRNTKLKIIVGILVGAIVISLVLYIIR